MSGYQNYSLSASIDAWVRSVQPSQEEFLARQMFFGQIYQLLSQHWDRGYFSLEIFGSSKTNLLLPGSDIDMVILDKMHNPINPMKSMDLFTRKLQRSGLFKSVYFVRQAKVPIIKITHKNALTADISCNQLDGIEGSQFILKSITVLPSFRPVLLVVKKMLALYGLNDASNGGLGSFALSIMVLAFLGSYKGKGDWGDVLLGFLQFYGERFDAANYGISALVPGAIVTRPPKFSRAALYVGNPLKTDFNVAAACRKWDAISALLKRSWYALTQFKPHQFKEPRMYKPGDFSPFPILSALHTLKTFPFPAMIANKISNAVNTVIDKVRPKRFAANDEVIIIDEDDEEREEEPSRKRRREDDSDRAAKKQNTNNRIENSDTTYENTTISKNTNYTISVTSNNNNNKINDTYNSNNNNNNTENGSDDYDPDEDYDDENTNYDYKNTNYDDKNTNSDDRDSNSDNKNTNSGNNTSLSVLKNYDENNNNNANVNNNNNDDVYLSSLPSSSNSSSSTTTTTTTTTSSSSFSASSSTTSSSTVTTTASTFTSPPSRAPSRLKLTPGELKSCQICDVKFQSMKQIHEHTRSKDHITRSRRAGIFI